VNRNIKKGIEKKVNYRRFCPVLADDESLQGLSMEIAD
jgi:hypothetical protein